MGFILPILNDFAQTKIPNDIMQILRLGQMPTLNKETGGMRDIVVGSIIRRLVCKIMTH